MQRVRVGLIGLAWVFLLVAVATIVLRAAEGRHGENVAAQNSAAPNDPLADLGVAPGNPVPDNAVVDLPPIDDAASANAAAPRANP
ncbi:hypothetical protein [uncultured Sphingomonas sp.]|uniref:hypothetical protein n=1 Tax=uncultured Sphingomonas sp. TaxID=158754 RepID=UPI0025D397B7|nr:hypothetical protein [uncultured Sphingomonas sp.]